MPMAPKRKTPGPKGRDLHPGTGAGRRATHCTGFDAAVRSLSPVTKEPSSCLSARFQAAIQLRDYHTTASIRLQVKYGAKETFS
jgi:hypothetical protein